MRQAIAAILALLTLGCPDQPSTEHADTDLLKRENAALTERLKAIEKELADARTRASQSEEFAQQTFERVKRIEAVLGERLYGATAVTPAQRNMIETLQKARAAITESPTPHSTSARPTAAATPPQPRYATTATTPPSPPAGPSPAEFMSANRFVDAREKINAFCARRWATDVSMQAFCIEKQSLAASKLDNRGKPFGMDRAKYERIRVDCFKRWGADYDMRLFCEEKEFAE